MLEQAHTSPSDTTLASAGLEGEGEGEECYMHASQFISSLVPRILLHTGSEQIPKASKCPGNEVNVNQGYCKPSGVTA